MIIGNSTALICVVVTQMFFSTESLGEWSLLCIIKHLLQYIPVITSIDKLSKFIFDLETTFVRHGTIIVEFFDTQLHSFAISGFTVARGKLWTLIHKESPSNPSTQHPSGAIMPIVINSPAHYFRPGYQFSQIPLKERRGLSATSLVFLKFIGKSASNYWLSHWTLFQP